MATTVAPQNDPSHEEGFRHIIDRAAESVLDATDEEIREEMRLAGDDPEEAAERLRAKLRDASERGRKHRLGVWQKRWQRSVARIEALDQRLPGTPAERLDLLYTVVEAEPQLRQMITVQHHELKDLPDEDVSRYLRQLADLGALDDLWIEGDEEQE